MRLFLCLFRVLTLGIRSILGKMKNRKTSCLKAGGSEKIYKDGEERRGVSYRVGLSTEEGGYKTYCTLW